MKTVLIVDGNAETRLATAELLGRAGYEVLQAETGAGALAIAIEAVPDAVLLDIDLPDAVGWDVLDQLRSESGVDPIRVIVFASHDRGSASDPPDDLATARVLPKPFEPDDLVATVNELLSDGAAHGAAVADVSRRDRLQDTVADSLEPAERVLIQCDGLMRIASQLFAKCKVVLTDRRLIVLKQTWPWGYKVGETHELSGCLLERRRERFDGSTILDIRDAEQSLRFYFARRWSEQAEAMVRALGGS